MADVQLSTRGSVIKTAYEGEADTNAFTDAAEAKLAGIEAAADVTDTANVTAAGALMDSEVDADIKTLVLPANTTISAFGATLVDDAAASNARTTLGMSANGSSLVSAADYAAMRTLLALVIGTNVQAWDADLDALAALTAPATKLTRLEILVNNEETASFTFALTDAQSAMTRANHATVAITATVPLNSSVAFPVGSLIHLTQWGAAAVTIAATGGVTINKPASKTLVLAEQYAVVTLWKQATDTWLLFGHLTDA